jgi:drug/metabolite transporter (DMT)-like permease
LSTTRQAASGQRNRPLALAAGREITQDSRMRATTRAQLQIQVCVLLWGFTAILGRLISLPALPLVFWRMSVTAALLLLVPHVWRSCRRMPPRLFAAYAGVGGLLAIHWLTFYGSIKLANASVGATCMALTPVFLAFVEPLLTGRRFDPRDVLLGGGAVVGVVTLLGGVPSGMQAGVAVGTFSAFVVAIFSALNKRLVEHADALAVTTIEIGSGAALVAVLAPLLPHAGPAFPVPGARDAALLLALAIGCTIIPYALHLVALRHLSAFAVALATNLEPVYAILLAMPLLGEHHDLAPRFYVGVAIVLGAVVASPLLRQRTASVAGV